MEWKYDDRLAGPKRLNRTVISGDKGTADEKLIQGIGRVRDVALAPDDFIYALTEDTGLLIRILPVKKKIKNENTAPGKKNAQN